jgi:hypothetical protein
LTVDIAGHSRSHHKHAAAGKLQRCPLSSSVVSDQFVLPITVATDGHRNPGGRRTKGSYPQNTANV